MNNTTHSRQGGQKSVGTTGNIILRGVPPYKAPWPYIRHHTPYSRPIPVSASVENLALLLLPLREISYPCNRCCEKEHTHAHSSTTSSG